VSTEELLQQISNQITQLQGYATVISYFVIGIAGILLANCAFSYLKRWMGLVLFFLAVRCFAVTMPDSVEMPSSWETDVGTGSSGSYTKDGSTSYGVEGYSNGSGYHLYVYYSGSAAAYAWAVEPSGGGGNLAFFWPYANFMATPDEDTPCKDVWVKVGGASIDCPTCYGGGEESTTTNYWTEPRVIYVTNALSIIVTNTSDMTTMMATISSNMLPAIAAGTNSLQEIRDALVWEEGGVGFTAAQVLKWNVENTDTIKDRMEDLYAMALGAGIPVQVEGGSLTITGSLGTAIRVYNNPGGGDQLYTHDLWAEEFWTTPTYDLNGGGGYEGPLASFLRKGAMYGRDSWHSLTNIEEMMSHLPTNVVMSNVVYASDSVPTTNYVDTVTPFDAASEEAEASTNGPFAELLLDDIGDVTDEITGTELGKLETWFGALTVGYPSETYVWNLPSMDWWTPTDLNGDPVENLENPKLEVSDEMEDVVVKVHMTLSALINLCTLATAVYLVGSHVRGK